MLRWIMRLDRLRATVVVWGCLLVLGQVRLVAQPAKLGSTETAAQADPEQTGPRLMITSRFPDGGGALVRTVTAGGPGSQLYDGKGAVRRLKPGDRIVAIDGAPFSGQAEYVRLLTAAAARDGEVELTVVDGDTGDRAVWKCRPKFDPATMRPPAGLTGRKATAIKALITADTNDPSIGDMIKVSVTGLSITFAQVPGMQTTLRTGADITAQGVINAINAINVNPTDTLLHYHLGHGAYSPNVDYTQDSSGGHYFQTRGGDLPRATVWKRLKAKGAQLTILITDTCNVPAPIAAAHIRPNAQPYDQQNQVLGHLLSDFSGDIDVSGSSRGQFGWFSSRTGGWWTEAFLTTARPDQWSGELPDWRSFLVQSSALLGELYQTRKASILESVAADSDTATYLAQQADQRPQTFRLNLQPAR